MQKPLLDFPCLFPIKIIGFADDSFEGIVVGILNQHVPDLGEGAIQSHLSSTGKYLAITATINAKNQEQLDALYQALSHNPNILVVL